MRVEPLALVSGAPSGAPDTVSPAARLTQVTRRFGNVLALDDVSLDVARGEVHAVLGPNGAGKTTLLRIMAGLASPSEGSVTLDNGTTTVSAGWEARHLVGLVSSGERSFYLRLSGLENLQFFARLHGLARRTARDRGLQVLDRVGLAHAADRRVGLYSQGMRQRLSVARALLVSAPVLLVDEATHDLDPDGARLVRDLIAELATEGAAVLWATQRLDEVRGFATRVTLLHRATVRFQGSVEELVDHAAATTHVIRLDPVRSAPVPDERDLAEAVAGLGSIHRFGGADHYLLRLAADAVLGEALQRIMEAGAVVTACREERSEIEEAFLLLTRETVS